MLNKQEITELLKQKNYNKIIHIFRREYTDMLINFIKKNNIELNEDAEVEEMILIISDEFPNLEGYMDILSNILTSPEMNIGEHLNYMLNNYELTKNVLT